MRLYENLSVAMNRGGVNPCTEGTLLYRAGHDRTHCGTTKITAGGIPLSGIYEARGCGIKKYACMPLFFVECIIIVNIPIKLQVNKVNGESVSWFI